MLFAGVGVADAAPAQPTISNGSNGFPARIVWKWYDAHTPVGFLHLPIGPACYGLTIMQAGVTDFDGYSICTDKLTWERHVIGSPWFGFVGL
jgi:hypothetical protein